MSKKPGRRTLAPGDADYRPPSGREAQPYEKGNKAAMKHGATSTDVIPLAEAHARDLIAEHVHLTDGDWLSVRSLAIAEERVVRLAGWLAEHGDLDEEGTPRPALKALREWVVTASNLRGRLGLDPVSRASLAVDELHARRSAQSLAEHDLAEGRRLWESR